MKCGRIGVLSCALCSAACTGERGEDATPGGQWEREEFEFFTYHHRPGAPGDPQQIAAAVQRRLGVLWDYYGVPAEERVPVVWYRFSSEEDFDSYGRGRHCPTSTDGCTNGSIVYSPDAPFVHELVHAAWSNTANPPYLFREGLAVYHSCSPARPSLRTEDWRDMLHEESTSDVGARFFAELFSIYGPDEVTTWFRSMSDGSDERAVIASFEAVFAENLDDVWNRVFMANNVSTCNSTLLYCGEAEPLAGDELGPIFNPRRWTELAPEGVRWSTGGGALGEIQSCEIAADRTLQATSAVWNHGSPDEVWFLPGGRPHLIAPPTESSDDWGRLGSLEDGGATCGASGKVDISALTSSARGWILAPGQSVTLEVSVNAAGTLWLDRSDFREYKNGESPSGWVVELCLACDGGDRPTECSEAAGWDVSHAEDEVVWLRFLDQEGGRDFLTTQFTWIE